MIRVAWLAVVLALGVSGPAGASAVLEFLSIEANEGASSGGHAALRLGGDTVYHFVHERPGLLRLERTPWPRFELRYRMLENRAIVVRRIPVSEETHGLVEREFARRYVADAQAFATRRALAADRAFLASAVAPTSSGAPSLTVDLPTLGLFAPTSSAPEPALAALRAAIPRSAVDERIARTTAALRALPEQTLAADVTERGAEQVPPPYYGVLQRLTDATTTLEAVGVLQSARGLGPTAVRAGSAQEPGLTAEELALVPRLAAALTRTVRRLLGSSRPDVGVPIAVAMARLTTLERSVAAGRWMFLDAYGPEAVTLDPQRVAHHRPALGALFALAQAEFRVARTRLDGAGRAAGGGFPEAAFAEFEAAGNRLLELDGALAQGQPLRVQAGMLVPSLASSQVLGEMPWPRTVLRQLETATRERQGHHERALLRSRGYGLLSRNCVTELRAVIDLALARVARQGRVHEEWLRRLGGELTGPWPFDAIPATSAVLMDRAFPQATREELPSLRHVALARLRTDHRSLLRMLREASPFTSSLYRPGPDDSTFLFFTDDTLLARPLLGAANLGAGLMAALVGTFVSPFDGGHAALAGLRGVLFSLPELVLINIRKGTYDGVPCGIALASGPPVSCVPGDPPG